MSKHMGAAPPGAVPAVFYEASGADTVICGLCPHECKIAPDMTGLCHVRRNIGGALYAESYGRITSLALDPIEKKPLYHFHPGHKILSIGSYGCNFRCAFCQNHDISAGLEQDAGTPDFTQPAGGRVSGKGLRPMEQPQQQKPPRFKWRASNPAEIAALSLALARENNIGVAYTYNEPLIGYEFVEDCAKLIRLRKQKNVLVTNGFIKPEPFRRLLPLIDAMNIDLKSFNPRFYQDVSGTLDDVKRTIQIAAASCHVEVTTLIIPGKNDDDAEMEKLCLWLAAFGAEIPLHISRFFPRHRMTDTPPTPVETVYRLVALAKKHLAHVYPGNCPAES